MHPVCGSNLGVVSWLSRREGNTNCLFVPWQLAGPDCWSKPMQARASRLRIRSTDVSYHLDACLGKARGCIALIWDQSMISVFEGRGFRGAG